MQKANGGSRCLPVSVARSLYELRRFFIGGQEWARGQLDLFWGGAINVEKADTAADPMSHGTCS